MASWVKLILNPIKFEVLTQVYPTKGHLVYEYNPFRNYRLNENMFEYKGDYYTLLELEDKFGITVNEELTQWSKDSTDISSDITLHEKGELVDFITNELSFSINHPVTITPQYSYDGSVNLIINDGVNIPRMINSRFSATGANTYEVVDRKGNNDTNIYDRGEQFDIDTSLYKRVIKIPKIKFTGVSTGGNLKVGNYHFYFKLSDADSNETDFVGESGLVSIFIGTGDPKSITSGQANENSYKSVQFSVSNIDTSYNYIYVYYSRYSAEGQEEFSKEYIKIDKKFVINNSGIANIVITGYEDTINISAADINLNYNIVDSAKTATSCLNMLFLGNVHKPNIPYTELLDLSLRFLPYLKQENYQMSMDHEYMISTSSKGYYDPKYIYEKTGYWAEEIYRLGIVYIMPNNELSPVFNIRGANNIYEFGQFPGMSSVEDSYNDGLFSELPVYLEEYEALPEGSEDTPKLLSRTRNYILYNESNYLVLVGEDERNTVGLLNNNIENVKGVVRFRASKDTDTIYSLDIRVDDDTLQELKKYVKGYFFVRLTRIPTILAQGITIGIDLNAYTPCIATADGYLSNLSELLDHTHVTTNDINDVNYITEGFLSRYSFQFEKKKSGLFGSILKGVAIGVGIVALAAATVFTCGAAGALVAGATLAAAATAGATAVATVAGVVAGTIAAVTGISAATAAAGAALIVGTVAVGTGATIAALGAIQEIRYGVGRMFAKKKLDGRNTKCPSGYKIVETDDSRKIVQDFTSRLIIKDSTKVKVQGILCPDYEVNQGYYNSVFTGNTHTIGLTNTLCSNGLVGHSSNYLSNDYRHFYAPAYYDMGVRNSYDFKIIGVPDGTSLTGIDTFKFRSRAGSAEEAWRYECIGDDYKSDYAKSSKTEDEETISNKQINTDIVRGDFGPYLAFNDKNSKFSPAETVNIYIPEYSLANMEKYFGIRMLDNTPFSAISDRYDINETDKNLIKPLSTLVTETALKTSRETGYTYNLYRGDCYICLFTHRMHRNFCDPSAPYNDEIVQDNTWRDNYDTSQPEKYAQINLGDVNAVQIGTWVTFKVRSSYNLNIRTLDGSDVTTTAMTGHPKGYYPYNGMFVEGTYKHADSQVYNKGFSKSISERLNKELPDVPYIKNWFGTRIMYSDIHLNDAYKNGYRVFKATAYKDYTREYGEIVKLVTLESDLICVFEHGVARIPINREQVAKQVQAGNNQITSFNVLPEAPIILSDMFGSQWADSVLKTPGKAGNSKLYIYGVDTVAKKIWRTDGQTLECISDFKVQEFLNKNITLGERELTPILGVRNVKTVYNAFKRDVMFTFYDNTYGFEEKVWNLCWSELLEKFITFYSWVPSFMENINNVPFSFDRNISKWIAKLGTSHELNSFADGITLSNTVINNYFLNAIVSEDGSVSYNGPVVDSTEFDFTYTTMSEGKKTVRLDASTIGTLDNGFIGVLGLANRVLPEDNLFYTIEYELERDPWGSHHMFLIKKIGDIPMSLFDDCKFKEGYDGHSGTVQGLTYPIYGLFFASNTGEKWWNVYTDRSSSEDSVVYIDDNLGGTREYALIPALSADPEVMMSELYYRNSAGHAYADYDINKMKYTIDNSSGIPTYEDPDDEGHFYTGLRLDPNEIYNIEQVMDYVARNYYNLAKLPSDTTSRNSRGESLLTRSGGPFDYNTVVFLGNRPNFYACSGGLGDLIDHGEWHAPFANHYMYGSYIDSIVAPRKEIENLPIFKDINGRRPMLPREEQLNPDKIVTLLNIRATVKILDANNPNSLSDTYYNMKASYTLGTSLINAALYESVVGITTKWNLQFLTSDFWKHGQAGIFDIADEIYPTYWYGKQHPFEFECVVIDDPSIHKIFTNLELVANKAKPESFHYEVVGETYDFAKDKVNMYFRLEAMKALWQYNGADITYDRNFLKVQPRQVARSADLIHRYYTRLDTINDIEDYYIHVTYPTGHDYRHLSGAEIVYYPTRQEFRVWNHAMAVDINDLSLDDARSIISANCHYLEDRWKVTINPILVCYKNEYKKVSADGYALIHPLHSTWAKAFDSNQMLPSLPIMNSPIPDVVRKAGEINFPGVTGASETNIERENALYHLYDLSAFGINGNYSPLDTTNWLNDINVYRYQFGEAHNRKEIDVRDKFVKIRIRYSGEELAIIDFLNTIYLVSYA